MRKKRVDTREEHREQEERTSGCAGTKRRGRKKRRERSQAASEKKEKKRRTTVQIAASFDAHGSRHTYVAGEVIGSFSLSVSPSPSRAGIFKVDKSGRSETRGRGGGERTVKVLSRGEDVDGDRYESWSPRDSTYEEVYGLSTGSAAGGS
ncbi:hypothetical protein ALC62_02780 [Cyphomyrmex costatus]|uniref:Uncharacterized protein n=1 Tax=Cyphomyrmex costatus TaxID=456900 RepID=A0A151IMV4_9HYME|nr:hypothetical protein ALC62_02780 [Cyphomyrmex costatus]